jgi:glycosyltransferase involved in cell wall biosynthesis
VNLSLSVVVIGRNEGERLRRCLESVRLMAPAGDYELIYVDSRSSDNSIALATAAGATVIALSALRPSAALARNAGWRAARGEWILFLDGDTILHAQFPRLALDAARTSSATVVWGHRRETRPTANIFHRVLDLDWVYAPGNAEFCGGDALMRRHALEEVGGFDETLIAGEEPELCSRLRSRGHSILHIDAPMTGHDLAISRLGQYWRRASRAGYAYAQIARRTSASGTPVWRAEVKGNILRAAVILGALIVPVLGAILIPLLVARTAYRARWKSNDPISLVCYGLHSHLQQIPILAGQAAFWWDVMRNRKRGLIEYK